MDGSIQVIPLSNLVLSFAPAAVVLLILRAWTRESVTATYGLGRMVAQLLLVGYTEQLDRLTEEYTESPTAAEFA